MSFQNKSSSTNVSPKAKRPSEGRSSEAGASEDERGAIERGKTEREASLRGASERERASERAGESGDQKLKYPYLGHEGVPRHEC